MSSSPQSPVVEKVSRGDPRGKWFVGFGIFLFVCGVAGYLSNPAAAKTALISGSLFGGLSALWGALMLMGRRWAVVAATLTTLLLCGAFSWRSVVSWQAVAAGEPKTFAASLISLMLLGSILSLVVLITRRPR